ncbi:MAG: hypothetical protein KAG98_03615 [Lentisphaeria bacterium]|nr:hypothetical protein [Lentisphaeria bacterium]
MFKCKLFFYLLFFSCVVFAGDPFAANHGFVNIELGTLNAAARTHAAYQVKDELGVVLEDHSATNELEITRLGEGVLQQAGLQLGDKIVGANGTDFTVEQRPPLGTEPREGFGTALWNSGHSADQVMTLKVKRGTEDLNFSFQVPAFLSDELAFLKICDEIQQVAGDSGSYGNTVSGAIMGLTLLSSNQAKYQKTVKNKADYLVNIYETEAETYNSNWRLAYFGTFLTEYYLATGDSTVVDAIKWCGHKLAIHSNGLGCVSHNGVNSTTFSENPYGIRGMSIISTQMLMVFNLIEKAGLLTDPFDIAARDKTEESLLQTIKTSTGAVDYIIGRPTGLSDSQGRSAKYALAMALSDKLESVADGGAHGRLAAEWLVTKKQQLLYGHAASFCSFWASTSALYAVKPTNWKSAIDAYNWYRALSLSPSSKTELLNYIPGRQNPGGDSYLGTYNVVQALNGFMTGLAAGHQKLHIHGGREKNWYKVNGVNAHLVEVSTGPRGGSNIDYELFETGEDVSIIITPKQGFQLSSLRSQDGYINFTGDPTNSITVSITNIQAPQSISAVFSQADAKGLPNIAGLALQIDASEIEAVSGSDISMVRDLSGHAHHSLQPTASKRPTLIENGINNLPTINFSGSQYLDFTGTQWRNLMASTEQGIEATWYFVTSINELMTARPYWDLDNHSYNLFGNYGGGSTYFGVVVDQYGFRSTMRGVTSTKGPRNSCRENEPVLLEVIYHEGDLTLTVHFANGSKTMKTINMGALNEPSDLEAVPTLGNRTKSNISNYFRGKLGEVILYNRALGNTEREQVKDYLLTKWIPSTSDAALAELNLSGVNLYKTFEPYQEQTYELIMDQNTTRLNLSKLKALNGGTITAPLSGEYELSELGGEFTITVTSANGSVSRDYQIKVLPDRVLHWTFDEADGATSIFNQWPGEYTGVLSEHTDLENPARVTGVKGKAIKLQAHNSIEIDKFQIDPPYSLSFWFKHDSADYGASYLFSSKINPSDYYINLYPIKCKPNAASFVLGYYPAESVWTQLTLTCDGQKTDLYVNGQHENSVNNPSSIPLGVIDRLTGTLDELKIYRRVLKQSEIYNASILDPESPRGFATEEYWSGISGTQIADLTGDLNYSTKPTQVKRVSQLETNLNGGHDYGRKVSGYIHPPITGNYTFYVSGDDSVEFHLALEGQPLSLIASTSSWTNFRQWDKYSKQRSVSLDLDSTKKYYFELLHKEAGGGNHYSVAWEIDGGSKEIIDGKYLSETTKSKPKVELTIRQGWNLLSLPSSTFDLKALAEYGSFWFFNKDHYKLISNPKAMQGFWLFNYVDEERKITLYSNNYGEYAPHTLNPEWTLVGPIEPGYFPKTCKSVYSWNSSLIDYDPIDLENELMTPGKGYWLESVEPEESQSVMLP